MKILVCMKQVMDTDAPLRWEPGGSRLREDGGTEYRANRYDEYALEQALLLKDRTPDTEVHVLSLGPDRVTPMLGRALSKGADEAIHLRCDPMPISPFETAGQIARYAAGQAFDLVLAGVMSEDAMQCQTGPLLAAMLNLPCAVSVVKVEMGDKGDRVLVEAELEGGMRERIALPLPALLTIQTGETPPRYPPLSGILRAKGKEIRAREAREPAEPREEFLPLAFPSASTKGMVLAGTADEKAERLLAMLHERSLL
jgi:electron transfer flavoprotein beta subunit